MFLYHDFSNVTGLSVRKEEAEEKEKEEGERRKSRTVIETVAQAKSGLISHVYCILDEHMQKKYIIKT